MSGLTGFEIQSPPAPRPIPEASEDQKRRASPWAFPSREFNDEDAYNDETDTYVRARIKVSCPSCERTCAPLLSSRTRVLDGGWRWVGLDHQEPYVTYLCICPGCGDEYRLTTYTPQ